MKNFFSPLFLGALLWVGATALLTACDDDTASIGTSVMPSHDAVTTSQGTYVVHSKTIEVDSVLANTNDCYLGRIIDPDTRALTTCNFLAQFHVLEDYAFPSRERMVLNDEGQLQVDSCVLRVFIDSYYGDSLATMTMRVSELDTSNVVQENTAYYTDMDLSQYVNASSIANTSISYAVKDLSRPDSLTDGSTYLRSIVVHLPQAYGRHLLDKYYENPTNYRDSYQFIHHVCAGFYFQTAGGVGSMINARVTTLDVYFKYHDTTSAGTDTIIDGMQRLAATEEVIQSTQVSNSVPAEMADASNPYTYIKSPASLLTELTLPVDDIVAGQHYTDTINSASLSIRCASVGTGTYALQPATTLLLVRKEKMDDFFENSRLPDDRTAFLATYSSSNNAYSFDNISTLVTALKNERDELAGVLPTDGEAERQAKYAQWEAKRPDWNKVMLVPVKAEYSSTTNSYGVTVRTLMRVRHDMSLSSARLEGGTSDDLKMNVIYSRFAQ